MNNAFKNINKYAINNNRCQNNFIHYKEILTLNKSFLLFNFRDDGFIDDLFRFEIKKGFEKAYF